MEAVRRTTVPHLVVAWWLSARALQFVMAAACTGRLRRVRGANRGLDLAKDLLGRVKCGEDPWQNVASVRNDARFDVLQVSDRTGHLRS